MNYEVDVASIRSGTKELSVAVNVTTSGPNRNASDRSTQLHLNLSLDTQIDVAAIG